MSCARELRGVCVAGKELGSRTTRVGFKQARPDIKIILSEPKVELDRPPVHAVRHWSQTPATHQGAALLTSGIKQDGSGLGRSVLVPSNMSEPNPDETHGPPIPSKARPDGMVKRALVGVNMVLARTRPAKNGFAARSVLNRSFGWERKSLGEVTFQRSQLQGGSKTFRQDGINMNLADEILLVDPQDAMKTAMDLARYEGIFTGTSGGATVATALEVAQKAPLGAAVRPARCELDGGSWGPPASFTGAFRQRPEGSTIVAMVPDTAEPHGPQLVGLRTKMSSEKVSSSVTFQTRRYLSTPLFGDIDSEMNEAGPVYQPSADFTCRMETAPPSRGRDDALQVHSRSPAAQIDSATATRCDSTASVKRRDGREAAGRPERPPTDPAGTMSAAQETWVLEIPDELEMKTKTTSEICTSADGMWDHDGLDEPQAGGPGSPPCGGSEKLELRARRGCGAQSNLARPSLRGGAPMGSASKLEGAELGAGGWGLATSGMLALGAASVALLRRHGSPSSVALRATRVEWFRKVKRISGDRAIFDVTVKKPMGLVLEYLPDKKGGFRGVGISEVVQDGNAYELNKKVCVTEEEDGMWILEGDRVIGVNGTETVDSSIDDIARLVGESEGDSVSLTLCRNTRLGPIKVVMMPSGNFATVRRNSRLSAAVEFALGKEIKYGCIDGWCGTCWHRERVTGWLFKPCSDLITTDWDNVMPMVLFPKPEKAGDATLLKPRGV
ncbi:unnamed protein product [Durusdinium trenchii]|uniref:PDZ domain-containing protein n=1 Tax=Durusdinium trenchii TaxID=1381693 RepID=A0ABP0S4Z6_9DINO